MGLGQVLVLADEDDRRYPEFFCFMLLEPLTNDLCLANVCAGRVGLRVVANEYIYSGLFEFLASQKLIKLGAGSGDSLPRPIGNFGRA